MMTHKISGFSILPEERFEPCKVCGEPSSGWHCGAVTCEACKKFFLRSINGEDVKYKCIRNKNCVIVRTTRTQCQYCRFQKCKEVGMTNSENSNSPTVAEIFKNFECVVCGNMSSGIHFGAITCEGCKGFFRRSTKERAPEKYRCLEQGNCEINSATRNMCRHCRFQKCLKVGMSSENSRIGRQSNLFKHNILEFQNKGVRPNADYLVTQRKMKRIKNESMNGFGNTLTEYEMFNMNFQSRDINNNSAQQIINVNQYTNQTYIINNINADGFKIDPNVNVNNLNVNYNGYYGWPQANYNNPNEMQMIELQSADSKSIIYQQSISSQSTTTPIEDSFEPETRQMIKTIYNLYMLNLNHSVLLNKDLINKNSINYNHQSQLAITYNGYQTTNNSYSNDINYYCLHEILEHFRFYALKLTNFLSNIHDFEKFSNEDKEELIKCSIHSVILLSLQRKCDHYNYFNCEEARFEIYVKIFPIFSKTSLFMKSLHDKFEKFKLDDREYALYSLLLILSTGSRYLKYYDKIMELREKVGLALHKYMIARRIEETACDEIILMLPYFKKFNFAIQRGITASYLKIIERDGNAFKDKPFIEKAFLPNYQELELIKTNKILNIN